MAGARHAKRRMTRGVCHAWCMVVCAWRMVLSAWCIAHGAWRMMHGTLHMLNGVWHMHLESTAAPAQRSMWAYMTCVTCLMPVHNMWDMCGMCNACARSVWACHVGVPSMLPVDLGLQPESAQGACRRGVRRCQRGCCREPHRPPRAGWREGRRCTVTAGRHASRRGAAAAERPLGRVADGQGARGGGGDKMQAYTVQLQLSGRSVAWRMVKVLGEGEGTRCKRTRCGCSRAAGRSRGGWSRCSGRGRGQDARVHGAAAAEQPLGRVANGQCAVRERCGKLSCFARLPAAELLVYQDTD
eukprot:366021-Chlamydomonas_euryale.AAC.6